MNTSHSLSPITLLNRHDLVCLIVWQFAAKMSCMFGLAYIREQLFSTVKINRSKTRSHISNEHIHVVLWANSSKLEPNIDILREQKQGQHSRDMFIHNIFSHLYLILRQSTRNK